MLCRETNFCLLSSVMNRVSYIFVTEDIYLCWPPLQMPGRNLYKIFSKQGSTNPLRHSSATFIRLKYFSDKDFLFLKKIPTLPAFIISCLVRSCCSISKITFWLTNFSQKFYLSCDAVATPNL